VWCTRRSAARAGRQWDDRCGSSCAATDGSDAVVYTPDDSSGRGWAGAAATDASDASDDSDGSGASDAAAAATRRLGSCPVRSCARAFGLWRDRGNLAGGSARGGCGCVEEDLLADRFFQGGKKSSGGQAGVAEELFAFS